MSVPTGILCISSPVVDIYVVYFHLPAGSDLKLAAAIAACKFQIVEFTLNLATVIANCPELDDLDLDLGFLGRRPGFQNTKSEIQRVLDHAAKLADRKFDLADLSGCVLFAPR